MPKDLAREQARSAATDGALSEAFLSTVGTRIRELRTARDLTVQQLADRAEISRRLMTQIELGQANPSLVTMTRIARQLDTEFTTLLAPPRPDSWLTLHDPSDHTLVWSSDAGSTAHLLQATPHRAADLWLWHLEPGDQYRGMADPDQSYELFYVIRGTLTLSTGDEAISVAAGSSARLRSDRAYRYANGGSKVVEFVRSVALSRNGVTP